MTMYRRILVVAAAVAVGQWALCHVAPGGSIALCVVTGFWAVMASLMPDDFR